MELEEIRAKKLYAQHKSPKEIAKELGVSVATIYRWIKKYKEEFEEARKLADITASDMEEILDEAHKKMLINILENPENLKNPKTADALIKIANVLEKMALRSEREKAQQKMDEEEEKGVLIVDDIGKEKEKEKENKKTVRPDNS